MAEVVGSTGLTTAMSLTLYNLSTELGSHLLLLVHGLVVEVHLCLDVMVVVVDGTLMMQSCHLDILDLCLVDT